MSCREFHENGWLFLSGELDTQSATAFNLHLRTCESCRTALEEASSWADAIDAIPAEQPCASTRRHILKTARMQVPYQRPWKKWMQTHHAFSMGLPTLATAVLLILLWVKPWHNPSPVFEWESTAWDEISALSMDIDQIAEELDQSAPETMRALNSWNEGGLSTMTQDITALRRDLEHLNSNDKSF